LAASLELAKTAMPFSFLTLISAPYAPAHTAKKRRTASATSTYLAEKPNVLWTKSTTPSPANRNYVAQIELKFYEKPKVEVRGGAAGVEGLRGLLATDASGKEMETPDPLLVKLSAHHFEKVEVEVSEVSLTEASFALTFSAVA